MKIEITSAKGQEFIILRWIICGFFVSICESYSHASIRRPEAYNLVNEMVDGASDITDAEREELKELIDNINNEI